MNDKKWKGKAWEEALAYWHAIFSEHKKDHPWKDAHAEGMAKWDVVNKEYNKQYPAWHHCDCCGSVHAGVKNCDRNGPNMKKMTQDEWNDWSAKCGQPVYAGKVDLRYPEPFTKWKPDETTVYYPTKQEEAKIDAAMKADDLYKQDDWNTNSVKTPFPGDVRKEFDAHNPTDAVHKPKKPGLFYFADAKKAPKKKPDGLYQHAEKVARATAKKIGQAKLKWMSDNRLGAKECIHGVDNRSYAPCVKCEKFKDNVYPTKHVGVVLPSDYKSPHACSLNELKTEPYLSSSQQFAQSQARASLIEEALKSLDQDLQMLWVDQSILEDRLQSARTYIDMQGRRRMSILRTVANLKQTLKDAGLQPNLLESAAEGFQSLVEREKSPS